MLMIRSQQMDVFHAAMEKEYARKAKNRLCALFPKHAAFMGDCAVSEIVRRGIGRACEFHFKSERGIQTYLSLMVYFGTEFHRDPQYAWMRAILDDTSPHEKPRIDQIIERTSDYSEAVAGSNHEYIDKALSTLMDWGAALLAGPRRPKTPEALLPLLREIYPEKAARLGSVGLASLIQSARSTSERHDFIGGQAVILFALLMLILGTFADEDPQFPWIGGTLFETRGQPDTQRLERLATRFFERLAAWVAAG